MDSFLFFYSSSKGIIHKLKVNKSVAVTDNCFKSYFAKVIETPELQFEVKKLLKGGPESYTDILDLIRSDFYAQDTGEKIRDSVTTLTTSRRVKIGNDEKKLFSTMSIMTKK